MPFKLSNSVFLTLIGVFFILDRFLKMLVAVKMKAIEIIPDFFQIVFYPNTKGPFSLPIPISATVIISALLIIILLILIMRPPQFILRARSVATSREVRPEPVEGFSTSPRYASGLRSNNIRFALILITAGAASNLFDRIVYGYTIDTFQFLNFSFFNLADGLIFMGVILLLYKIIKK